MLALITSDTPRPLTTSDGAIGIDRNRSVTPYSLSIAIIQAVFMNPNAIVIANIPGMAKSL